MTGESAQRILAGVDASWRRLRDAADELGPDGLERLTPAGWMAKEMLAHVAFWEEAVIAVITLMYRNQELPQGWTFGSGYYPGDTWPAADVHNAREAAWARSRSSEELMERWAVAHQQLLATLATVTDAEAKEQTEYFGQIAKHLDEHLPELQALLVQKYAPVAERRQ